MSRSIENQAPAETLQRRQFASDNYAGICPEAWKAIETANSGHTISYGDDPFTARACELIRDFFETECDVFFTFNGTAANALALASLCNSYHAILCHEFSHVETDECGAPEFFCGGAKVVPVAGQDGKMDLDALRERIERRDDVHFSKARAISLTQATEVGTVYSVAEIQAIGDSAKHYGLKVHMDGARFANAMAALDVSASKLTWQAGVDVLSFGGTKNGIAVGDAVVFFDRDLARDFAYRRKQAGQLCSKMRFLSAPWVGLLEGGAVVRHARHANDMARRLRDGIGVLPGVVLPYPTEANSVFVDMPPPLRDGLRQRGWRFYALIGENICRLMCAWDTTEQDVDELVRDITDIVGKPAIT